MRNFTILACVALALAGTTQYLRAAPDNRLSHTLAAPDAIAAWDELRDALTPPPTPPEWQTKKPSRQEWSKFYLPYVTALQDKARDFYTRFPTDVHVLDARKHELQVTLLALQVGATNQQSRLDAEEKILLSNPALGEDDRFEIRRGDIERAAQAKESEGQEAMLAEYEKGVRTLQKEFTNNPAIAEMLVVIARNSDPSKARGILEEVTHSPADPQLKMEVEGQLKQFDSIGKPVEIQYTAVDGREVDMAKLKGKVVLVDFWATWCPPCVREVPNVKAAYDKLHSQGFEIVGISLDDDKSKLTDFIGAHGMDWPQYYDGLHWDNKLARKYQISAVPAMWLVDKKGVLRDVFGESSLSRKVTKLLAE